MERKTWDKGRVDPKPGSAVQVFARIRPTAHFARDLIECLPDGRTLNIYQKKDPRRLHDLQHNLQNSWSFPLEGVLHNISQEDVYAQVCRRVVAGALSGYNGTVVCFGQTGAGKTFTMTGSMEYRQRGLIPRALAEVFQEVGRRIEHAFSVHLSYLEIYNETLVDLLAPQQASPADMVVTEDPGGGVHVKGLSLHPVHNADEALHLMFMGGTNRIIGSNTLNRHSSRSHCIFTIHLECRSRTLSDAKFVTSKLNLVDLAGSERLRKTGSEGKMLKEAVYINKSLTFLEQAILALAERRREHIPFRQSKLTHALKDSLGGNCNTVLVANIFGEAAQIKETLSTLRFASRMKCVRTEPAVNLHVDPVIRIKELEAEIVRLREELAFYNTLANRPSVVSEALSEAQLAEVRSQVQRFLDGSTKEVQILSIRQVQEIFSQLKTAFQDQQQQVQEVKAQLCQLAKEWDTASSNGDLETVSTIKSSQLSSSKGRKSREKSSLSKRGAEESPSVKKSTDGPGKSKTQPPEKEPPVPEVPADAQDGADQRADGEQSQTCALVTKSEAFEEFKLEEGRRINSILHENKAMLAKRRGLYRQLTDEVNSVKSAIDRTAAKIQNRKDAQGAAEKQDDVLMLRLKDLKNEYRQIRMAWKDMQAEVNYCQHLVDQTRVCLLTEFEAWYKRTLLTEEQQEASTEKTSEQDELSQQSSARLQADPLGDEANAESFYNARYRFNKQRNFK
ncbi:kinesin-like protein KIF9 [Neosynchiropus ocellatus]